MTKIISLTALAAIVTIALRAGVAHAISLTGIAQGKLPDGEVVSQFEVTFDPGDTFPWHYHPGPLYGVIVSGQLTEDHGCGAESLVHNAGEAFFEEPGRVHEVHNYGGVPVLIAFQAVTPSCFDASGYNVSILVNGPRCKGNSGQSHLEKIPDCH